MNLTRLAIVLAVFPLFPLRAAEEAKPRPTFRAVRAEKAPHIDADLSDSVSQNAPETVPGRNVSGAFVTKLSRGSFTMTTTSGAANVTVSTPGAFVRGEGLRFYATPPCI